MIFAEPLFLGPTIVLCLQKLGHLTLHEIYTMESVCIGLLLVLEIPSGALADLLGRKKVLLFGLFFRIVNLLFLAFMTGRTDVWIANILWVISFALKSGADQALLYDSLTQIGQAHDYAKIQGKARSGFLLLTAICSLFAGWVSEYGLRIPLYLSVLGVFVGFCTTCLFVEPVRTKRYNAGEHITHMKEGIKEVAKSPQLLWVIVFVCVVSVSSKLWFFTYNPYFELVDLRFAYYGVIFFLLNIVAFLASRYAHLILKSVSWFVCCTVLIGIVALPMLAMGLCVTKYMVAMVLFQNIARGFMNPFISSVYNKYTKSEHRATVISCKSAISGLVEVIGMAVFAYVLGVYSLPIALQILAIFLLVFGVGILSLYRKVFSV
ncbi:MAG: hypothetical protein CL685_00330 [Candidatus Magasanikbacteria bacterium]|nr:hypothetical protein [Candidatus Magasanikbacteria bacterium]